MGEVSDAAFRNLRGLLPRIAVAWRGEMTAHQRLPVTAGHLQADDRPVWNARDLTAGEKSATIVLDGMAYMLRITRAGKLILTK